MHDSDLAKISFAERCLQAIMALAVLAAFIILANGIAAQAAEVQLEIDEIDYEKSTISIILNDEDNFIYMSNGSKKKWEYVPAVITERTEGSKTYKIATLDISWVSVSKDYIMSFKGDYSQDPISVKIPKQQTGLKVKYDMYSGTVNFTGATADIIQWKKKDALYWQDYDSDLFSKQLSNFIDNGTSLQFRIMPENGYSEDDPGRRAGKEVSLSISKKTAAPTITVNDATLTITAKKNLEYRYVEEDGTPMSDDWGRIPKDGPVSLYTIAPEAMYSAENETPKDVYVQFRQAASSSAQMSKTKTVKIPAQEIIADAGDRENKYKLEYTSNNSFKITFAEAGSSIKYEYCIITPAMEAIGVSMDDLSNSNIKWNDISSSEPITLGKGTNKDLVDESTIYFRRKAQNTLGDENYKLASPYYKLATITYPGKTETGSLRMLYTIDGMCSKGRNSLDFTFTSKVKGTIKKIEFIKSGDSSGSTAEFTSFINDSIEDGEKVYVYNVTLTDLSNIKATRQVLYAYVYFEGQEGKDNAEIQSDEGNGFALYVYPGTVVNNPSTDADKIYVARKLAASGEADRSFWDGYTISGDKVGFTSNIKRVYKSKRTEASVSGEDEAAYEADQSEFRFKLDIGTKDAPDLTYRDSAGIEKYTSSKVVISKILYDNVELTAGTDYKAEYYNDTKDGKDVRYAVVTLYTDKIEQKGLIDDRNKDTKFFVHLSNGEVVSSDNLTMNLQLTATPEANKSISFTEGKLEAWKETTKTEGGVTTTSRTRTLDQYFKININIGDNLGGNSKYNVAVTSVTWRGERGDINILYQADKSSDNTIEIILDSDLLNGIRVNDTMTNNIRIEMSNGYVITSGIPMTIHNNTSTSD